MKVLVLDDNLDDLQQVRRALTGVESVEVSYSQDPEQALEQAAQGQVDVFVSDINMPQLSGIELVARLRATKQGAFLPTIFLTGATSDRQAESLLRGGDAVMTKPVIASLLIAQIEAFRRLAEQRQALEQSRAQLKEQAKVDLVTGLWNRQGLQQAIRDYLNQNDNTDAPCSLLVIDVDHFKQYSEFHGHTEGEVALQTVASAIRYGLRHTADLAGRYGWQEFVVCLPATDVAGARKVAEGIVRTLSNLSVLTPSNPRGCLTVSLGISTVSAQDAEFSKIFEQASQAVLAAKQASGDRIALFRPSAPPVVYDNRPGGG